MVYPTTAAPRTTRSNAATLKPRGVYGYAFVVARFANFAALVTLITYIGRLLALPPKDAQSQEASLIATLVLVGTLNMQLGFSR